MPGETSSEHNAPLTLRPVAAEDEEFLVRVYASTRAEELALVPWNDQQREAFVRMQFNAQRQHYQSNFPTASHHIIERDGQALGRLYVLRTDDFIRIMDITLLPEFRNNGSGTTLIKDLMNEAAASRRPLRIYVENFNPSLRLFNRLGFKNVDEQGMHLLMEWNDRDDESGSE
ncbi:MAG TPA: GNAT family N-acetyltransferase [Pyrinomonadaceae bacterium]|jgi:N-acetylglutamate synthase-like GNAT family acetyltransferase